MYEVLPTIAEWYQKGERVALATVISTWGSSPRGVGAKMACAPGGKLTGSVSGGCVENAVYEAGMEALATGKAKLLHFGVSDETAFEVGLACGGNIDVFVQPLSQETYEAIWSQAEQLNPFALITVISGPENLVGETSFYSAETGLMGSKLIQSIKGIEESLQAGIETGSHNRRTLRLGQTTETEEAEIFIDPVLPPPTLIIVGGAHIAVALAPIAKAAGYRTIIIDPRRAFGSEERFPAADLVLTEWPQEAFRQLKITQSTAFVMLTHDPKIDDPALTVALQSSAFYIGALGSSKTQKDRRSRMQEYGIPVEAIKRIHGPVGLDIGARTPEEIAVAIMAQIIAARNGKD